MANSEQEQEPFFMSYINKLFGDWSRWKSQRLGVGSMTLGAIVGIVSFVFALPDVVTITDLILQALTIPIWIVLFGFSGSLIDELL